MTESARVTGATLKHGGKYNWKGQPERLVYLGREPYPDGYWYQFALVGKPNKVWCEVRERDLDHFEESKENSHE